MAESTTQSATVKFSENLLNAFEAVNAKSEVGLQVAKDLVEFFKKRAGAEESYAKTLLQLYKTPIGTGLFTKEGAVTKEYKSLKETITAVQDVTIAEKHQELATTITSEVVRMLENWIKQKDAERKKISADGLKLMKTVNDAKANVAKAKDIYEKTMKEAEAAREAYEKAEKDEKNQPDNKKLPPLTKKAQQRHQQVADKGKQLETAYQTAVTKANEEIETFLKDKMPGTLELFQKWEEERWNTVYTAVSKYRALCADIPTSLEERITKLETVVNSASLDDDFKDFVDANKKDSDSSKLEFVKFKGKYTDEVAAPETEEKPSPKEEKPVVPAKVEENTPEKAEEIKKKLFADQEDEDIFKSGEEDASN